MVLRASGSLDVDAATTVFSTCLASEVLDAENAGEAWTTVGPRSEKISKQEVMLVKREICGRVIV